jgi:hypothetical protein
MPMGCRAIHKGLLYMPGAGLAGDCRSYTNCPDLVNPERKLIINKSGKKIQKRSVYEEIIFSATDFLCIFW